MPTDYLVTDTELTSVANAIRTKGGTSASLAFPAGFVSAIGALPDQPSYDIKTGSILSITTQRMSAAKALTVNIDPYQSGSGDPAPDNVRPFKEYTSVNIYVTGKNLLFPYGYAGGAYNPTVGTKWKLTDRAVHFLPSTANCELFTVSTTATWQYYVFIVPVKSGLTYHRKMAWTSTGQMGASNGWLTADFEVLSKYNSTSVSDYFNSNITPIENAAYWYLLLTNRGTAVATLTFTRPEVNLNSSETTYEPFKGCIETIYFGGTYYGGTLDAVNGTLTPYTHYASYNGETLVGPWLSSMDVYAEGVTPTTGAEVVDLGSTDTAVTLVPRQIPLLAGFNQVFSDSGDVTIEYQDN